MLPCPGLEGGVHVVAERQRQLGAADTARARPMVGATAIKHPTISSKVAPAACAISTIDW